MRLIKYLALAALMALPTAALADSGNFDQAPSILGSSGFQSTYSFPTLSTYASNGSVGNSGNVGNIGSVDYITAYTFTPSQIITQTRSGGFGFFGGFLSYSVAPYTSASLTTSVGSISGVPTFNALLYNQGAGSLANSTNAYQAILANSQSLGSFSLSAPGQIKVDSPLFLAAVNNALGRYAFAPGSPVTVAFSAVSGGKGAGVPGPIAGAGLPVLAAAGLAWLARRRRQVA